MDWVTIVLVVVIFFALLFIVYYMKMNMAFIKVIKTMKKYNAIDEKSARFDKEMNLKSTITSEMMWGRDYCDQAILDLRKHQVIQRTKEGKIYLVIEKLADSKWKNIK